MRKEINKKLQNKLKKEIDREIVIELKNGIVTIRKIPKGCSLKIIDFDIPDYSKELRKKIKRGEPITYRFLNRI